MKLFISVFLWLQLWHTSDAFCPSLKPVYGAVHQNGLLMAMDDAMMERLNGIKRSYQALTERLGDPDVIADSKLLMKIMSDRSKSEDVVNAFDEVSFLASMIFILKLGLALSLINFQSILVLRLKGRIGRSKGIVSRSG